MGGGRWGRRGQSTSPEAQFGWVHVGLHIKSLTESASSRTREGKKKKKRETSHWPHCTLHDIKTFENLGGCMPVPMQHRNRETKRKTSACYYAVKSRRRRRMGPSRARRCRASGAGRTTRSSRRGSRRAGGGRRGRARRPDSRRSIRPRTGRRRAGRPSCSPRRRRPSRRRAG